ncbi:MAG: hypothetical protein HUU13_16960 [Burkholderiaceae bacterium]|nr:hypothetical protein [Burkholderiaceae bacterium]
MPTLALHSGRGVHCWWRLAEPCRDLAAWTAGQKSLIQRLRSDPTIHDPARIMRLPGFLNRRAGQKSYIVATDGEPAYTLAMLDSDNVGDPAAFEPLLGRPGVHYSQLVAGAWR